MDVDGDQHDPNIEPEIKSSEMQDRGGADFGFHSLLTHNNNCEGTNESDEDSFDSDDGFCSVDDDESLFDKSVVIDANWQQQKQLYEPTKITTGSSNAMTTTTTASTNNSLSEQSK